MRSVRRQELQNDRNGQEFGKTHLKEFLRSQGTSTDAVGIGVGKIRIKGIPDLSYLRYFTKQGKDSKDAIGIVANLWDYIYTCLLHADSSIKLLGKINNIDVAYLPPDHLCPQTLYRQV